MNNSTFTEHSVRLQTTRSLTDREIVNAFSRFSFIAQLVDDSIYDVLLTNVRPIRNETLDHLRQRAEQLSENTFVELDRIFTTGREFSFVSCVN